VGEKGQLKLFLKIFQIYYLIKFVARVLIENYKRKKNKKFNLNLMQNYFPNLKMRKKNHKRKYLIISKRVTSFL